MLSALNIAPVLWVCGKAVITASSKKIVEKYIFIGLGITGWLLVYTIFRKSGQNKHETRMPTEGGKHQKLMQ